MTVQYCSYCDAGREPLFGTRCPECDSYLCGPMMTDELRAEIAEIERRAKAEFETAGQKLFGAGFTARHARPYRD